MASSKKNNDKNTFEDDDESVFEAPVVEEVVVPAPKVVPKPRGLSFSQWAALRGFRPQHLGGMRAFLKNPSQLRTAEAWDKAFEAY